MTQRPPGPAALPRTPAPVGTDAGRDPPAPGSAAWLLERQCRIAACDGGTLFRFDTANAPQVLAIVPPLADDAPAPTWLAHAVHAARRVLAETPPRSASWSAAPWLVQPLPGATSTDRAAFIAVQAIGAGDDAPPTFAAFLLHGRRSDVALATERLAAGWAFGELRETREALAEHTARARQAGLVIELAAVIAEQTTFKGLCTALCDLLAARLACDRVSLGLGTGDRHLGRSIRVRAMSHTERILVGTQAVQDVELAMEECLDQDDTVVVPDAAEPTRALVNRAARELSASAGGRAVLSLPLRTRSTPEDGPVAHLPGLTDVHFRQSAARVRGVLTLERSPNHPFSPDEADTLRVLLDLLAPQIVQLARQDRWLGARAAASARAGLAVLLGPRHTWLKLTAAAALALGAFLAFAHGTYRVEAPFRLEAIDRRVVPAPFDGFLREIRVRPGDTVVAGETVLARLDDTDLRLELAQARAEYVKHVKDQGVAQQEQKAAEEQIARAEAAGVQARIDLLEHRIARATILAPISGVVLAGDLDRMLGAPLRTGDTLFEIAPSAALRAELAVDEDQIGDVAVGQRGRLAAAALPDQRFELVMTRIDPVADVVDERNVFRVRAMISDQAPWMRPGMEGLAKIEVDRRRLAWIWSRRVINWVRMKLWV